MQADRFVTVCFLYSGVILLGQYVVVYRLAFDLEGLLQLAIALSILTVGIVRLRYPEEEADNPPAYGLLAYGLAALSIVLTAIFIGQVALLAQ